MTYAKNFKVQASDFNTFAGSSFGENINSMIGVGFGNYGYGQTTIPLVSEGNIVDHTEWTTLRDTMRNIASHQNTTLTDIPEFSAGNLVEYVNNIASNKNTLLANRLNALGQGTTTTTPVVLPAWTYYATITHVVTFESADKARYFFNAGGQLAIGFYQPGIEPIDLVWSGLMEKIGTLVLSAGAPTGANISTIAGVKYTGFQQNSSSTYRTVGRSVYKPYIGYYALTTGSNEVFSQTGGTTEATSGSNQSSISVSVKSNGAQGRNGDNGSTVTITTKFSELPGGLMTTAGTTVSVTVRPPSTMYLTNSWGNITVAGSKYSG